MLITLLQVDAFTAVPFKGNPAAVCLLDEARDAAWMQAAANERPQSLYGTGCAGTVGRGSLAE